MRYMMTTALLAPVLWWQGKHVRRTIPRLPEAQGERSGHHLAPMAALSLRVLIVGDSAAAGVGAIDQQEALSGQLIKYLASNFSLQWALVAKTGYTLQDIIQHLEKEAKDQYDIVVVSIGVNDVTGLTPLKKWLEQQQVLVDLLKEKFSARYILFSKLPPMHLFPALPQPLRWYMGGLAKRLNKALKRAVTAQPECRLIEIDFPLQPDYVAIDGFHPSEKAYSLWAESIVQELQKLFSENNHA